MNFLSFRLMLKDILRSCSAAKEIAQMFSEDSPIRKERIGLCK